MESLFGNSLDEGRSHFPFLPASAWVYCFNCGNSRLCLQTYVKTGDNKVKII